MAVGLNGAVAAAVGGVVLGPPEDVRVQVDEPGDDIQARGVGDSLGAGRVDLRRDVSNLPVGDRDIHDAIDPVLRVDDVTTFDEQTELRCLRRQCGNEHQSDERQHVQVKRTPMGHFWPPV